MLLKATSFIILNELMFCQRNHITVVFAQVGDRTGCHRMTVGRHVGILKTAGLIETYRTKGPGTRYMVNVLPAGKTVLEQWRQ